MAKKVIFEKIGPMRLPTLLKKGRIVYFRLFAYRFARSGIYFVVEKEHLKKSQAPLVRIQSACSFAHVFNSQRCDDKAQFDEAMLRIGGRKGGLLIYAWPHEGRGVGMWDHVRVYMEQDKGADTVSAYENLGLPIDKRVYGDVIAILKDRGIKTMRLLTNNPARISLMRRTGFHVTRESLVTEIHPHNESQIRTKVAKLGHLISVPERNGKNAPLKKPAGGKKLFQQSQKNLARRQQK